MEHLEPMQFRGKRVTVAGLGRFGGGIAVARWLVEQGAKVLVTDRDPAEKLADSVAKLAGLPIEFCLGEHRERDFTDTDLVVTSPALPPNNPFLILAKNAGVPVTTEIRLLIERLPLGIRTVGITGTKGKSTTTKLLSLMLATKHKTWVGGNIGGSLLASLPEMKSTDVVVLELSSYMLEHLKPIQWSPQIAVVTMLTIDHLEWHGSSDAYFDAKKNLLRFQSGDERAVICTGSEMTEEFVATARGHVSRVSVDHSPLFQLTIPGHHNQLNAQLAFAAAAHFDISHDAAQLAIRDFEGLPHRLQRVHVSETGVSYFNDSIATIPEAAIAALCAFPPNRVIQIVGGYDKHLDLEPLCVLLSHRARATLCIGATGAAIADVIQRTAAEARIEANVVGCGDLTIAVECAKTIAEEGDIVLLSPGCASYDQFNNFEARGDAFTALASNEI